jgi:hypothetical protein
MSYGDAGIQLSWHVWFDGCTVGVLIEISYFFSIKNSV